MSFKLVLIFSLKEYLLKLIFFICALPKILQLLFTFFLIDHLPTKKDIVFRNYYKFKIFFIITVNNEILKISPRIKGYKPNSKIGLSQPITIPSHINPKK